MRKGVRARRDVAGDHLAGALCRLAREEAQPDFFFRICGPGTHWLRRGSSLAHRSCGVAHRTAGQVRGESFAERHDRERRGKSPGVWDD